MAVATPTSPFVWGAGGAMKTPEQIAREREIAAALMQGGSDFSPVDHWMQGAARAAQAGVGALKDRWAGEAETAGREGFQSRWDSVFGGQAAPVQTASIDPVAAALTGTPQTASDATAALAGAAPAAPGGDMSSYVRQGMIARGLPEHVADAFVLNFQDESGLNPGINEAKPLVPGSRGGYGLYQLTGPRRVAYEAYAAQRGVDPSNVDAQLDFMMSELQGPEAKAAQAILSAPDTGSAAAAIVNQFLRPAPEHRASRTARYTGGAATPAGGSYASPMQVAQGPDMSALLGLASDPWANDAQRSIIQSLMGQQMQQQDPMYQLQMQAAEQGLTKGDLEIQALLNPAAPAPEYGFMTMPDGTLIRTDKTSGGFDPMGQFAPEPEPGFTQLSPDQAAARNLDPTKSWQVGPDNRVYEAGGGGVNVTVGGASQTPGDDKFYETMGAESGKRYSAMIQQGSTARRNLSQLDVASDLLATAPQGPMGVATLFAGKFGIDLGGLNETQALNAVIEQMVPTQREPGSGPMSDKDIEMYRGSVVSLSNMPGGNALIIDTARAINQYDVQISEIAGKVEDGILTRAQAREEMSKVPNPIDAFREGRKKLEQGGAGVSSSTPSAPAQGSVPGQRLRFNPVTGELE